MTEQPESYLMCKNYRCVLGVEHIPNLESKFDKKYCAYCGAKLEVFITE